MGQDPHPGCRSIPDSARVDARRKLAISAASRTVGRLAQLVEHLVYTENVSGGYTEARHDREAQ